ncbi:MAG: PLP-dependent aminotransferase family protein [Rhodospirillales bacterium]|nr:PLP-dependent aminotransferase family protein [Rhodospirillales bacterium]
MTGNTLKNSEAIVDAGSWPNRDIPPGRPQYVAIVDALESDILRGAVAPGTRLPARRNLAERLNVSLGTVTKAYEEAEYRGLVTGEVGRGTFVKGEWGSGRIAGGEQAMVRSSRNAGKVIDLSLNVSPYCGEAEVVSKALLKVGRDRDLPNRLGYHPHEGMASDRAASETWLSSLNIDADAGTVSLCHGAQHAISIAVKAASEVVSGGVLTEAVCFAGLKNVARFENLNLIGVDMDQYGILPEAVEREVKRTGARLLFLTPTLQTPTGAIMPEQRRREIADLAERHDLYIIEDDAYGFLFPEQPTKLHSLVPDRVFYISSISKIIAPALRLGILIAPPQFQESVRIGLASTGWMASPLLAGAFSHMLDDGSFHELLEKKRHESQARLAIAHSLIPLARPGEGVAASFHIWIPFSSMDAALSVYSGLATRGILLTSVDTFRVSENAPVGLRVCLGGAEDQRALTVALHTLRDVIANEAFQFVV